MARKLAKAFGWFVGTLLGLGLVAYCVLLLANLHDQPRSPVIDVLLSARPDALSVSSDDNSYLFMLGFSGPPDADPMALGRERHEWMLSAAPEFNFEDDPLRDDHDFRTERNDAIAEFSRTCSESESECLRLLNSGEETAVQWLANEGWLFDRYSTLVRMTEFHEACPFEVHAPLPAYHLVLEGQRLMLVTAWQSATAGDAAAVGAMLEKDLTYWRMVLERADTLITKMIATAAIVRHFKLGNLALRRLPDDLKSAGIPPSWRREISDAERSMKRTLAGEWRFFDGSARRIGIDNENPFIDWTRVADPTAWDRFSWLALKPFWQHQDTSNHHARLMLDLGNVFDVPYREISMAIDNANQLQASAYRGFSRLYNFTGDLVTTTHFWTFSDYALRVSDLEGIRRAAWLVAELRADGVTKEDVIQHMLNSEFVDPYTSESFSWHDGIDAIVFQGLESHERSRHELIY